MSEYSSYFLYQKYIKIGTQDWVPVYPIEYAISGDTGQDPVVYKENDPACGYVPVEPIYRWHQLPISEDYECSAGTKYYKEVYQVSYDNGLTWEDVVPEQTRRGDIYETGSSDCIEYRWTDMDISTDYICDDCPAPPTPQYRTLTTATTCINYDKYVLEEYQVSYDSGVTWTTTGTSATTLIEADSPDCGYVPPTPTGTKWLATYTGGTTSSGECDASSAITENEVTLADLQSVLVGDCVITIGNYAFSGCSSITSVTIPDSVTSIGNSVFNRCSGLTSVTIGSGVTSIGMNAFNRCTSLTSINIPSGVTSIGDSAFYNCSGLTSITIPDSVTSIGIYTFYGCQGLTSVTIGSGVTSIGVGAFSYCRSLTSVTIPDSVTSISGSAFYNCTGLTSVNVNATTPPTLGSSAFNNTNNCPIYVPAESVNAYQTAWSDYASRIQAIP